MNPKKDKRVRHIIISLLICVALFLSVQASTISKETDAGSLVLGASSHEEKTYNLEITTEGSLEEGSLKLVLSSFDDIFKVEMTPPEGETTHGTLKEERAILGKSRLGQSSDELDKSTVIESRTVVLGSSVEASLAKFDAPVAGRYTFSLYDENNNLVGTEYYDVYANSGSLTVDFNDGKTAIDFYSTIGFTLDYSTNNLEKEKISIYLPPGFSFVSRPSSTSQYEAKGSTVPLPVEFYTGPNADILKAHTPIDTDVTRLEIIMNTGGTQAIAFTFSIKYNNYITVRDRTSRIMLAYGENPDKAPSNMGIKATSHDDAVTYEKLNIEGFTDVVRGSGSPEGKFTFPHLTGGYMPGIDINTLKPAFIKGYALSHGNLSPPHYPITNMKTYMSVPQGAAPPDGYLTETIEGNIYYVEVAEWRQYLNHHTSSYHGTVFNQATTLSHEELIPGTVYEMEPGFITYTLKAKDFKEYFMPKTYVTVPDYTTDIPGKMVLSSPTRVEQGGDIDYSFEFNNINANLLTPLYEDVKFTVDIPYGLQIQETRLEQHTKNNRSPLKHIEYYVYGDPVARIMTVTDTTTTPQQIFPLASGEWISKLIYHYDKWNPFTTYRIHISGKAMTHEPDGATLLPGEYPATLNAKLEVKDSVAVQMSGTSSPVKVVQTMPVFAKDHILYRLIPQDGLRFGSRTQYTDKIWENFHETDGVADTQFILKSVEDRTKDYENVQLILKPKTPADEAIFSWMTGINTVNFGSNGYSEKREVYYKTSKDSSWRLGVEQTPTSASTDYTFVLEVGEFVTEVMIDAGTIYGTNFNKSVGSDNSNASGEGHGVLSLENGAKHMMLNPILSRSHRMYFPGDSARQTAATKGDKWFYEMIISTDSDAQYIKSGLGASTVYNTNKGQGSLTLSTYQQFDITRNQYATSTIRPEKRIFYQGDTFYIDYANTSNTPNNTLKTDYEHYINFYVSVHKYFDILSLTGDYKLQSVKDIPGSDYRLYTYKGKTDDLTNYFNTTFTMYVRPDALAPIAAVVPINGGGISHDDFESRYITPGHENTSPYALMSFTGQRPFPVSWGITDKIQYSITGVQSVGLEMQMMDRIELLASSQGATASDVLTVYDHNKDTIDAHAFIGNLLHTELEEYEIELLLPRKDRDTPSIEDSLSPILTPKKNDIDFYISEKVYFPEAPADTTYTYYDLLDQVVDMDTATLAEMKSVARIVVNIKKFPARKNLGITLRLYTDYEKIGRDFDDYLGYIGANRKKKTSAVSPWSEELYTKAFPIKLSSYLLNINVGLDHDEIGQWTHPLEGAVDTKIYFAGPNGDEILHQGDTTSYSVKVNKDVSRITVAPKDSSKYMLTIPNYTNNLTKNSNFPRDPSGTSTIVITPTDLALQKANIYDAAFIIKPTVPIKDFTVGVFVVTRGFTTVQSIPFRLSTTGLEVPAASHYNHKISNIEDPSVVGVVINPANKYVYATGISLGSTTFTYTLINRLGDEFVVDGVKVDVVKNLATKAIIQKGFTSPDKNLGSDTFEFNIWNEGTATSPIGGVVVTGVSEKTETIIPSFIERGRKHYISEVVKNGYENNGYKGNIDGVDIVFKDEGSGVFSFDVPNTVTNVKIVPQNKNTSTDLTVKKVMDGDALAKNPTQAFVITVTEKGGSIPIKTVTLKNGETETVEGLIFGRTYQVKETPVEGFMLDKVALEQGGTPVGAQPFMWDKNIYEFKLGLDHVGSEIVVYNKLAVGKGLDLKKHLSPSSSLASEEFVFTLTGPTPKDVYTGKVASTTTVFPASVVWYDYNGALLPEGVAQLNIGEYTLVENAGTNYELKVFTVTSGSTAVGSTNKAIKFEVTDTSALLKATAENHEKEAGHVEIEKIVDDKYLDDTMAFTLIHERSGRAFVSEEKVNTNSFVFSSWKENGVLVPSNKLPFGKYAISETKEGDHYIFDKFRPQAGVEIYAGGKIATFTLDSTNAGIYLIAENKVSEKGDIVILQVPELNYGTHSIGDEKDIVHRNSDAVIQVESTLRVTGTWRLTAHSNLQTAGSETFPYQLLKYSEDGVSYTSMNSVHIVLDQSASSTGGIYEDTWLQGEDRGIVADLRFDPNMKAGAYKSTITWSLDVGP